ncbi:hypothetical protein SSCS72_02924 [Mammaliicoccus sciuri]|uniref:NUDIX domain-containing protein n=1 Tax=Mammaliicoccus sciuri TaxID=1296 RepID=UPI001EF3DF2D|nr:NUDIX domain-containing protein [Mammaliicoccus sciuri]CAG7915103.1 hypothetical protein SSCS72_02924 [Mammaliicoccus sciuri]
MIKKTWDGLDVSEEPPYGAVIIIYKIVNGKILYLVLHRAHKGENYEGRWAWGPPSGARFPSENIYTCMARELYEETGLIVNHKELDNKGRDWYIFYGEVPNETNIKLSLEHNKYNWLDFEDAIDICSPEVVKEQLKLVNNIIRERI